MQFRYNIPACKGAFYEILGLTESSPIMIQFITSRRVTYVYRGICGVIDAFNYTVQDSIALKKIDTALKIIPT